ncbi:very short patch repair endonuclease [Anaerotignum lactatifermentans]|uniref:very short patch repair endonuclease n=1 Tax=Anaerotignum lactatifermentans TaxID=160404 RepID=UPI0018734F4A|nr:very short patch repair endonuclease [Anaerotignum lactatifermentans]MBE5077531.1 very short patch repair endonuclease [Anaerotignum lactatifermentans]
MDNLTPEQRRKNMQAIKSKDTSIELRLRKALWHEGIRYRKNYKKLPGKPDIAITKYHIAVFCDSDFWHGYDWENRKQRIKSNQEYWIPKIERNMARDKNVTQQLNKDGWVVLRFWEWQIKKHLDECVEAVKSAIAYSEKKGGTGMSNDTIDIPDNIC